MFTYIRFVNETRRKIKIKKTNNQINPEWSIQVSNMERAYKFNTYNALLKTTPVKVGDETTFQCIQKTLITWSACLAAHSFNSTIVFPKAPCNGNENAGFIFSRFK